MFSEDSDCQLKAFELSPSVWKLMLTICPPREVDEVKKVLGESLVEQACDLHEEVLEEWLNIHTLTERLLLSVW